MTTTSQEERTARIEGIVEQMSERLGRIENLTTAMIGILDRKADKTEVRFLFGITITLICVLIGLVGGVLARV
jgi:hypothetical protein